MKCLAKKYSSASLRPELLPRYCYLNDEQELKNETILNRLELLKSFRSLPPEVFARLRHFQPQSGCFNKCRFCSQGAVPRVVEFPLQSLKDIIAVMKAVAVENGLKSGRFLPDILTNEGELSSSFKVQENSLIAHARNNRSAVIYCYLDNDPALYEHIDEYVRLIYENLGVKTRIATVGFSRHNPKIQQAFKLLSHDYSHCLAGVRLSISPYTYGWTDAGKRAQITDRDEFEKDLANFMSLFKQHFRNKSLGRQGVCAELRFRPMVHECDVNISTVNGLSILQAKNYFYVSTLDFNNLVTANIIDANNHCLKLDNAGIKVVRLTVVDQDLKTTLSEYLDDSHVGETCTLHKLANEDGVYFGVDVERTSSGKSYSKYFYPKTIRRPKSGLIDGERYLLNIMMDLKTKQHIDWYDLNNLVNQLRQQVSRLKAYFPESSRYISNDIIPIIESYLRILKMADYSPDDFLDKNLTIDTGQICNLGRAFFEYKKLASRSDLPLTPNHERAFGKPRVFW